MPTKYRFYITNTFDGSIQGSNNEDKVRELAACEEFFILDTKTGMWVTASGDVKPLPFGSDDC